MMSAFDQPGMSVAVADMCAYEKRRPDTQEFVKKPTVFKGTKEVCEIVAAVAGTGDHARGSVMGSWHGPPPLGPTGLKFTVSERAGGYTEQLLSERILDGAEKFLGRRRVAVDFPVENPDNEPRLGKESFMDADDAVQDDWSSNELPESIREELYQKTPKETRQSIRKAHHGLGHPSRSTFVRMLRLGGATPVALEYAKA